MKKYKKGGVRTLMSGPEDDPQYMEVLKNRRLKIASIKKKEDEKEEKDRIKRGTMKLLRMTRKSNNMGKPITADEESKYGFTDDSHEVKIHDNYSAKNNSFTEKNPFFHDSKLVPKK